MKTKSFREKRRAKSFALGPLLAVLGVASLLGCGSINDAVRGYGRSAAAGVAEGMPGWKEPTKKLFRDMLLEGDTLNEATKRVANTGVRTLTEVLADAEVQKRVDKLVEHTLGVLAERGGDTTKTLIRTAGPELRNALRTAVIQTMAEAGEALRVSVEKQLTPATELLARRTAEVLIETLSKAIEGPLGKKLEQMGGQMGQRLVGDAAAALAAPESKAAVAQFTESATRGALRGASAGVREGLPAHIQGALIAGLVVMGVLLLGFMIGVYGLWHRYRQSTTALAIVAEKINQQDIKEIKPLKLAIQKSASDNFIGPWLSDFLKHRGL